MKTLAVAHDKGFSLDSDLRTSEQIQAENKMMQNEQIEMAKSPNIRLSMLLEKSGAQNDNLAIGPISIPISPNSILNEEHRIAAGIVDEGGEDSESANQRNNTTSSKGRTSTKQASKSSSNKIAKLLVKTRPIGAASKEKLWN